jgi:RNA polymerase sigma-70 factor (ECF subfamily)
MNEHRDSEGEARAGSELPEAEDAILSLASERAQDAVLVAAANRGDRAAFERLYLRHREWMMAVAFRLIGEREAAGDIVQDAILAWLRRFPGFTLTGSVRAYLYTIIRHLAIDRARSRGRWQSHQDGHEPEIIVTSGVGEPIRALDAAVARLPLGQREVLLLHFGDGLTLVEVAQALEVPVGTVKSRLGLALASLRADERLRADFGDS